MAADDDDVNDENDSDAMLLAIVVNDVEDHDVACQDDEDAGPCSSNP